MAAHRPDGDDDPYRQLLPPPPGGCPRAARAREWTPPPPALAAPKQMPGRAAAAVMAATRGHAFLMPLGYPYMMLYWDAVAGSRTLEAAKGTARIDGASVAWRQWNHAYAMSRPRLGGGRAADRLDRGRGRTRLLEGISFDSSSPPRVLPNREFGLASMRFCRRAASCGTPATRPSFAVKPSRSVKFGSVCSYFHHSRGFDRSPRASDRLAWMFRRHASAAGVSDMSRTRLGRGFARPIDPRRIRPRLCRVTIPCRLRGGIRRGRRWHTDSRR